MLAPTTFCVYYAPHLVLSSPFYQIFDACVIDINTQNLLGSCEGTGKWRSFDANLASQWPAYHPQVTLSMGVVSIKGASKLLPRSMDIVVFRLLLQQKYLLDCLGRCSNLIINRINSIPVLSCY